ncbi:MAG: hypothetical protein C0467_14450 [Planctomycetaceae bacterium]|nr:hypothetical protein [Planctomycetaceae bacterium]
MAESSTGIGAAEPRRVPTPPRVVAVSGMIFSALFTATLVLLRIAVPTDPADSGDWLADPDLRNSVRTALSLVPFTGIAFLWYMGVLRNRIGELEDRFFATVFLGSGLLFVAMLFTGTAVTQGLLDTFVTDARLPAQSETYAVGRRTVYALMTTFGLKMAAVFMFVTSMIGFRTGALSRWVTLVGFSFALVFLLAAASFPWLALLFPCWVMLVSTWILIVDVRQGL